MLHLTAEEKAEVVAKCDHLRRLKFSPTLPYAFTEHGALMLSSILNSPAAVEVSIQIVRVFVRLRETIRSHKELRRRLAALEYRYDFGDGWQHEVRIEQELDREPGVHPPVASPERGPALRRTAGASAGTLGSSKRSGIRSTKSMRTCSGGSAGISTRRPSTSTRSTAGFGAFEGMDPTWIQVPQGTRAREDDRRRVLESVHASRKGEIYRRPGCRTVR
jgi:hypothetical protein